MSDFSVRSDSVDVEQIMRQIRARIREKRGSDYTEAELQQLASVKLEKFLDPRGVRSDLVEQFRKHRVVSAEPPTYEFEDTTLYETHRGLLRFIRKLLHPILKLFINPNPLIQALHTQKQINAEFHRRFRQREEMDPLYYEVVHNLVVETTRLGIEVHNLKMRVESLSSRMDFDERRARSLEGAVQYRQPPQQQQPQQQQRRQEQRQQPQQPRQEQRAPEQVGAGGAQAPSSAVASAQGPGGPAQGSGAAGPGGPVSPGASVAPAGEGGHRRRRRRRRRRPGQTMGDRMGPPTGGGPGAGAGAGAANGIGAHEAPAADSGAYDEPNTDAGDDADDDGAADQ